MGSNGGAKVWPDEQRHFHQIVRVEFGVTNNADVHDLMGRAYGGQMSASNRPRYKIGPIRDEWGQRWGQHKPHALWNYICQVPGSNAPPYSQQQDVPMRDRLRDDIVRFAAQTGGRNWLLEDDQGNHVGRPIEPIALSPAPGSAAAAALARAPALVQAAIAWAAHRTGPIPQPFVVPVPAIPLPAAPAPVLAAPPTVTPALTASITAAPTAPITATSTAAQAGDDDEESDGHGDQMNLGSDDHDQAESSAPRLTAKDLLAMLDDDSIDDDEVIAEVDFKALISAYKRTPLPMVHQADIIMAGTQDQHFLTAIAQPMPLVDYFSTVYEYGGAVVKLYDSDGVSTDVMVCSADICSNADCYPDNVACNSPRNDHISYGGKPFVHVGRDCEELNNGMFFVGQSQGVPESRVSDLPAQVKEVDVWCEVDGIKRRVLALGCVADACFVCNGMDK